MKKNVLVIGICLLLSYTVTAQVGIGTNTPNSTAMLDVQSTDKGILIPRITTSARNSIANPAQGLLIYNTTVDSFQYRNATAWVNLLAGKVVPAGGTTGQFLTKIDGTDYNTQWVTPPSGGAQLVLQANKTSGTQILPNATGSGSGTQLTGDIVLFNNTTTSITTLGSYDNNGTFTVNQAGLYYVQAVTRCIDNATATNTLNQNLYVSIDNGDALNINSFHTIYSAANAINYPAGVKGKGYTSGMYFLNAGQTISIKGWSSNSSALGTALKTDGSCQLMIVKL